MVGHELTHAFDSQGVFLATRPVFFIILTFFIKTRTVVATSNLLFDKKYLSKNQDLL